MRVHYGLNIGTRFVLHFCQRPRLTGLALGGVSESSEIYYLTTWGPESSRGGGGGGEGGGSACVTCDAGGRRPASAHSDKSLCDREETATRRS